MTAETLRGASVFITGGAGFIGSHIVDQLLAGGAARIVVLDRLERGRRDNLTSALASGRVELTVGDIRDPTLVDRLVAGADIVCHQAALRITQCAEEPVRAMEVMIGGTQNVLEAAVRHGVRKVVAASSASVYGEASYLPMDEVHPFNNRTLYGSAKIATEQLLRAYAEMHGLRYVALRPFNVYGPRMDTTGVYTEVMIRWLDRLARHEAPIIFGDGSQTMDFVHVEDVARAYLLAMTADVTDDVFNVGTGTETSLLELCRLLCAATGQAELEPIFMPARKVNPVTRRQAAVDRARSSLCFEARIPLGDGLSELIEWHAHARSASVRTSIPITRPWVGDDEAHAAATVVRSGWLSQGQRVQEFEAAVAEYVGARHAVAISNCTSALHLALVVAGVGPGDEVICPSFSFIATANAIRHAGATPVFVDIDPLTFNLDPALVERAITSRTKAIMPVDQIGLAADILAIRQIARRHGIKLVEDAAPSLGAAIGEQRVGRLSDFTCFSFHPRKSITTGEGGMITTDVDDAADRLRRIRSHAASTSDLWRYQTGTTEVEEYRELGYNCRMTDVQAAIGIVQMGKLELILRKRRELAERYSRLLANDDRIQTPYAPPTYRHTYQSYCIRLRTNGGPSRATIMAELAEQGIATRKGVMATHLEPYYRGSTEPISLPVTEVAAAETLLLPLYAGMSEEEQDAAVTALRRAMR